MKPNIDKLDSRRATKKRETNSQQGKTTLPEIRAITSHQNDRSHLFPPSMLLTRPHYDSPYSQETHLLHTDPDLEQWIQAISVEEVQQPADPNLMSLTRAQKLVLENFNPIKTLADRLSKPNIMLAQGKTEEHAQLLDQAKIKLNGKIYILKDGSL